MQMFYERQYWTLYPSLSNSPWVWSAVQWARVKVRELGMFI